LCAAVLKNLPPALKICEDVTNWNDFSQYLELPREVMENRNQEWSINSEESKLHILKHWLNINEGPASLEELKELTQDYKSEK